MNVYIDGKYYYSPCEHCKEDSCYSCILMKYRAELVSERDKCRSAEFRIEHELEPRIKSERDGYDRFVSQDTGERACESFSSLLDDMIDFVENPDNEKYMDWEDANGNLEEKVLYLIKNRVDDDLYCITDKE